MTRTKARLPLRTKGGAWGRQRVALGISMRDLAKRSGVRKAALSLAEEGRYVPTGEEYDRVMDVLREQEEANRQGDVDALGASNRPATIPPGSPGQGAGGPG